MDIFGSFALVLALIAAIYALAAGIAAIITRKPLLLKTFERLANRVNSREAFHRGASLLR